MDITDIGFFGGVPTLFLHHPLELAGHSLLEMNTNSCLRGRISNASAYELP